MVNLVPFLMARAVARSIRKWTGLWLLATFHLLVVAGWNVFTILYVGGLTPLGYTLVNAILIGGPWLGVFVFVALAPLAHKGWGMVVWSLWPLLQRLENWVEQQGPRGVNRLLFLLALGGMAAAFSYLVLQLY